MSYGGSGSGGSIATGSDVALNNPTTGQVLTYDSSVGKWKNAAAPSGGGSSSTSGYIIYATNVPSGSGLSNIAADNSTDDTSAIQAILNYMSTTYGGGRVALPSKTIKCNGSLTVPNGVTLAGSGGTVLNFAGMSTSATAITATGSLALERFNMQGPNGSDKNAYPSNTCIGVKLMGIGSGISLINVVGFFYGINLTSSNTFGVLIDTCAFGNCGECVDMDQSAAHNGGTASSENGERMVFQNCVFYNSQVGAVGNGSGVDAFFIACSFDYLGAAMNVYDAFMHVIGCHLETGYEVGNDNWGSVSPWMINAAYTARIEISNCRFEVRDAGVYAMMTTTAGPATYNSGFVRLDGTNTWYGAMPTETRQYNDRDMFYWASSAATLTCYSPFASKWSQASAQYVANDGTAIPLGHKATITAMSVSTVNGNPPSYSVTLTRELFNSATANNGWVEVRY